MATQLVTTVHTHTHTHTVCFCAKFKVLKGIQYKVFVTLHDSLYSELIILYSSIKSLHKLEVWVLFQQITSHCYIYPQPVLQLTPGRLQQRNCLYLTLTHTICDYAVHIQVSFICSRQMWLPYIKV